jgi:hypothetical protein
MFTRRGHRPTPSQTSVGSDGSGGVEFKQPRFFAPQRDHDASSLADLLGQSFTLGQEPHDSTESADGAEEQRGSAVSTRQDRSQNTTAKALGLEYTVLAVLLSTWLFTMFARLPYAWETQLAALFVAGVIALRATGDTSRTLANTAPGPAVYISSALGVAELAAICWVGSAVWDGQEGQVGWYGAGALTSMLGHQILGRSL